MRLDGDGHRYSLKRSREYRLIQPRNEEEANTKPALFISYRRTHLSRVQQIEAWLKQAGIECFFDVHDIDPLADFPDTIREAIGRSHAFLAWWSADYGDSDYCLQEFRHAWQHAQRRSSDLAHRIWIVNAEEHADHVFSGELDSRNFLKPPPTGGELLWAEALLQRFQHSNLIAKGPLADERDSLPAATLYGVPEKSREFTGRGPELMRIHSKLHPARIGDQGSAVAVQMHGPGGVGKRSWPPRTRENSRLPIPGVSSGSIWVIAFCRRAETAGELARADRTVTPHADPPRLLRVRANPRHTGARHVRRLP